MATLADLLAAGLTTDPRPRYSAAVALVRRHGRTVAEAAVGEAIRYADGEGTLLPADQRNPADADTVFDLASITKLFTTTVLLSLVEEGLLGLDEPLARWLPPVADVARRDVTLRHLLTHTSGLPAMAQLWLDWPDRATRVTALLHTPLAHPPGRVFIYSCVGYLVAGLLAEEVTGVSLPDLVRQRVCRPLGLHATDFLDHPSPLAARAAATEHQPSLGRGMLRGSVHDENSWSLGGTGGNAGLFGTAADVATFGEMLRGGGAVDGVRILRAETVAEMLRDQLPADLDPGYRHGLGVRIGDPTFMGPLASTGAVGHTGFTGTSLVVDAGRGLVVVLLTNRVHPSLDWSDVTATRQRVAAFAVEATI